MHDFASIASDDRVGGFASPLSAHRPGVFRQSLQRDKHSTFRGHGRGREEEREEESISQEEAGNEEALEIGGAKKQEESAEQARWTKS